MRRLLSPRARQSAHRPQTFLVPRCYSGSRSVLYFSSHAFRTVRHCRMLLFGGAIAQLVLALSPTVQRSTDTSQPLSWVITNTKRRPAPRPTRPVTQAIALPLPQATHSLSTSLAPFRFWSSAACDDASRSAGAGPTPEDRSDPRESRRVHGHGRGRNDHVKRRSGADHPHVAGGGDAVGRGQDDHGVGEGAGDLRADVWRAQCPAAARDRDCNRTKPAASSSPPVLGRGDSAHAPKAMLASASAIKHQRGPRD